MQELETKLRNCEQMGVTASAEIQGAARKVLEENKRLRALLRERGIPEADIVAAMGANDQSLEEASSAAMLSTKLNQRRCCNGDTECPPVSCNGQTQSNIPSYNVQSPGLDPTKAVDSATSPSSLAPSSVNTPPPFPQPFPYISTVPDREFNGAEGIQQTAYVDQNPNLVYPYSQEANYDTPPVAYGNSSSCTYAANIIRTMREDVGAELEADLGCDRNGQECMVDNTLVFNVMEKYGNPPTGI